MMTQIPRVIEIILGEQDWIDSLPPDKRGEAIAKTVRCMEQAIDESHEACAWVKDYYLKPDIFNLGNKLSRRYRYYLEYYKEAQCISRLAIQSFWIAQRKSELWWSSNIEAGHISPEEGKKYMETLEAFHLGDIGWAFMSNLVDLSLHDFLKDRLRLHQLEINDVLVGIGLYWLCQADELMETGETLHSIEKISDAFSVFQSGWGYKMCDVTDITAREGVRRGAEIRHAPTHARRQQVVNHWLEHIHPTNPKLSSEKAGEWLHDSFPELSVRKLSEYIAHAKKKMKEIPPTSSA